VSYLNIVGFATGATLLWGKTSEIKAKTTKAVRSNLVNFISNASTLFGMESSNNFDENEKAKCSP